MTMHSSSIDSTEWRVSPSPRGHRRFSWAGGALEAAERARTDSVEGRFRCAGHLLMATISGGARHHEFVTDDGFRFEGCDRSGFVSFLPAGSERRLKLRDVSWEWVSIELPVSHGEVFPLRAFSVEKDDFLFGMLVQFHALFKTDGKLDLAYCDTMMAALAQYLRHRSGHARKGRPHQTGGLTSRQLREVLEYVEAHLGCQIRIGSLAGLCGLSDGYFHRAFRASTGKSPLRYINERRVKRAVDILQTSDMNVLSIALDVGFVSASHFARTFKATTGQTPDQFRRSL